MNPEKDRKRTTSPRKDALTAYNTIMPELAVVLKNKQKKSRKKQKRHVFVASGIYRHTREGTYHERPKINGKRTWRSLGVNFTPQRNFKAAEDEYHRRRVMEAEGKNLYAEEAEEAKPTFKKERPAEAKTVGEVIQRYMKDGFLDRHLLSRPETTEDDERRNCETLLELWDSVPVEDVCDMVFDDYRGWRLKNLRQGEGLRTTDRELNTLNNAYTYCKRRGVVKVNPAADRPKYQPSSKVRHCREFCPRDADELHTAAAFLFQHPNSVVLGFQLLSEAYSGLRTSEVLQWGTDVYGTPLPDGKYVYVWRLKGQHAVNPYCYNHEGMQALLKAHASWKNANFPDCPQYFPSHCGGTVSKGALSRALRRLYEKGTIKRKLTSHGAGRAFYVLVRRSQGIRDEVIAHELGHTSGGQCIRTTYGGIPVNWLNGEAPNLKWLPQNVPVAWAELEKQGWVLMMAIPRQSVPWAVAWDPRDRLATGPFWISSLAGTRVPLAHQ